MNASFTFRLEKATKSGIINLSGFCTEGSGIDFHFTKIPPILIEFMEKFQKEDNKYDNNENQQKQLKDETISKKQVSLTQLWLENNRIIYFPSSLINIIPKLQTLSLSGNK